MSGSVKALGGKTHHPPLSGQPALNRLPARTAAGTLISCGERCTQRSRAKYGRLSAGIAVTYRRISRAPCATSTSRRTDGGGLPIYTAISFAPSASQASPAHNGKAKAPHGAKPENKYDNMLYIMIGLAWLIALSLAVCLASTLITRRLLGRKERRRALKRLDLGPGATTRRSPATLVTIMAGMLRVL